MRSTALALRRHLNSSTISPNFCCFVFTALLCRKTFTWQYTFQPALLMTVIGSLVAALVAFFADPEIRFSSRWRFLLLCNVRLLTTASANKCRQPRPGTTGSLWATDKAPIYTRASFRFYFCAFKTFAQYFRCFFTSNIFSKASL